MAEVPFITDEMVRGMAEMMRLRAAADPLFAEDCDSLFESMPYLVRYDGAGRPVICECCGTYVCDLLEADTSEPRSWTRAIWEAETGRKHTLRRCTWIRDHGSPAPPRAPIGLTQAVRPLPFAAKPPDRCVLCCPPTPGLSP